MLTSSLTGVEVLAPKMHEVTRAKPATAPALNRSKQAEVGLENVIPSPGILAKSEETRNTIF